MIEVSVGRLGIDAASSSFVVVLQELGGERTLPIWIGRPEAESIAAHLNGVRRPRPMTHDLATSLITALGGLVRRVQVTRVQQGTYFAEIHVTRGGAPHVVDARPSDAIAIAVRAEAPIFVAEPLFDPETDDAEERTETADGEALTARELQRHLEHLRPEDFGRFLF